MINLSPAETADEAMENFIKAAYLGTGQDYRLLFKATDLPTPGPDVASVPIHISPHDADNRVDLGAGGDIQVAVLSDIQTSFDPLQVNISTVRFGPEGAHAVRHKVEEINGDGIADPLLSFDLHATGIECNDTVVLFDSETYAELNITGSDVIKTIGCNISMLKAREPIVDGGISVGNPSTPKP